MQEIFRKIYENHNEEVYLKDVVVFLRAAYQDIDDIHDVSASHLSNLDIISKVEAAEIEVDIQVKILLDQYDIAGDRVLTFNEFSVYIKERE